MSTLNDILQSVGGENGIASGAADIIGAIKGTPKSITYVQAPAPEPGISPVILIGGGLVAFFILFMVLKK